MRKLLQRLWDIAADFANFMGGLGMRLVWLPKLHFSPGAEHVRTDPGPALFVLNHSWWMDAPMLCLLCRRRRISVVAAGEMFTGCLLYTSPSPRDTERSRMPSSA